jgi:hypothetical protein
LAFEAIPKRHNGPDEPGLWRFENRENPSVSAGCGVVAFSEPLFWAIEAEERAANLEFDAGLSREEAERVAGLSRPDG